MHSNCFNLRPLLKKTLLCLAIALTTLPTVASEQTFGIIGDAGRATANAKSVRESLARAGVLELILPGDNLYSGTYQSVWQSWRNLNFQFPVVAIGNHNDGYPSEMSYFGMPAEYYSKVIDGVHFLVLNSDNNQSGRTQAAWLDGQLENATENLIFLVYHHPSYKISSVHTWTEKKEFQLAIRPIIWKHRHKLTALIVGHDHLASVLHFNDLPVILSGAVQEVRSDRGVDYADGSVRVKTAWYFDSAPYWAKLVSQPELGQARVDFIRAADDRLGCSVLLKTGMPAEMGRSCVGASDF